MATTVGERVRALRHAFGYTQTALARESGVSLNTIQRIEYGHFEPTLSTVRKLAATFYVNAGALAFGEYPMVPLQAMTPDFQRDTMGGPWNPNLPGYVLPDASGPWYQNEKGEWKVKRS